MTKGTPRPTTSEHLTSELKRSVDPVIAEIRESFSDVLTKALERLAARTSGLVAVREDLLRLHQSTDFLPELASAASAKALQAGLFEVNARLLECFSYPWKELATTQIRQEHLATLAEHGWFLDPEMPFTTPAVLAEAIEVEDVGAVTTWLADHFRQRVDDIATTLTEKFPSRARILSEAFDAHREGKYNLSIPVLLAQSDGMCKDTWAFFLFPGGERKELVAAIIGHDDNAFRANLAGLLGQPVPLWRTRKEREPDFVELNRHQVLHGESVNYGTEINSLKAISFLGYLSFILGEESDEE